MSLRIARHRRANTCSTLRRLRLALSLAALSAALLAGCAPDKESDRTPLASATATLPTATLSFNSCRLPQLSTAVQCATLTVPKDRRNPLAGTMTVHIAKLAANTPHPEPDPLILLAGGPGQAASALAPFAAALVDIRRTRDILLIDQRGTGRSSPLTCAALDEQDDSLSDAISTDLAPRVARCLEQLRTQNIDPLHYGTLAFVDDIDDARQALGLTRFNLWAGSYGTRVALEYLRRYGEHVRTLTLDGVMAPSTRVTLDAWRSREARLNALFTACEQSDACQQLQPPLNKTLDALATRLVTPQRFTVADPRTGTPQTLSLDFDALLAALQPLLYAPESTALIPAVLHAALNGDITPLLALAQSFSSHLEGQLNPALYYAITCAEDVPRTTADERKSLTTLRSSALAAQSFAACATWPSATLPDTWGSPVRNDTVPVLLLSGALDPVTPPAYANEVAQTLAHQRHITATGYGHIVSTQSCASQLLASLVKTASLDTLSNTCITALEKSTPPPLWPNRLAPAS